MEFASMADLTRDIQERMNNVAYYFAGKLRSNIQSVLDRPKFKASGDLRGSVRVKVKEANAYNPPVIEVSFVEYGEFIGKRKLLWTKMPSVKKIAEWVEFRGLADGSAPVPGYKNGAPNLPTFKRAERIAYAIARTKRDKDKYRRQPWKKESLPSVLKEMNTETLSQFSAHIERLFKESLEKGS